jgi:hypothetical protein
MKVNLDKSSINLEEVQAAKELQKEYSQYDNDTIKSLVNGACNANLSRIKPEYKTWINVDNILECSAKVTKNHYRLTVWIDCLVRIDSKTIVLITFDGIDAMSYCEGEKVDAYIEVYRREA